MRYIGLDIGDGESAVAAFEPGSGIEPVILPVCGAKSLLSAVGSLNGEIVIGERAYTDALADRLSVRFKSRFTFDPSSHEDVVRFVKGIMKDLTEAGILTLEDRFVVGCPAGWSAASRARYRELLMQADVYLPQVISESRAAFLYAKYARTVAMDIDIMGQSALVADIGSSTLDYAYIVNGHETGVGTFGETMLGGGILDAALLRRAVERSHDREAIEDVFRECKSWYSYCEIEARKLKEEYFTRLASETNPVVKKQLHICYDGVQKLRLQLDADEVASLLYEPLPELDGRTFEEAVRASLENAARITADSPPMLVLLTGGASRMPFFRDLCQNIFDSAIVVSCPEPEFSIAKGLAYAGWIDENLRAFRKEIHEELTEERVSSMVSDALPALLPSVADALTDLLVQEAAIPMAQLWKNGRISTLQELNDRMDERVSSLLSSSLAQEALAPAMQEWLVSIQKNLQTLVDPICDRYEVPRKEMQLNLTASGPGGVTIDTGSWLGLPVTGTLIGVLVTVTAGLLCGGSGVALIATGPLGFLAGAAIGTIASFLGWNILSGMLMKADIPLLLRNLPIEKKLTSDKTRHELRHRILDALAGGNSDFHRQVVDGFSKSFRSYIYAIAQAAEIPIE